MWQPCAATGRWHYSIVRTMTPWNHALHALLFCRYCCNSDGRFATLFEICGYDCCDSSIEICLARQSIYLVLRRGCWGRANKPRPWLFRTAVLESASALSLPLVFYSWEHRPTRLIIPAREANMARQCVVCNPHRVQDSGRCRWLDASQWPAANHTVRRPGSAVAAGRWLMDACIPLGSCGGWRAV